MALRFVALAAALLLASAVYAGWHLRQPPPIPAQPLPPPGYSGQWWTHPSGCQYIRGGRPGEIVWTVLENTIQRRECPRRIVEKPWPGDFDGGGPRRG